MLTQSCLTLCCPMGCNPWDFSGKNTGVDCHFLLQGIFPPTPQGIEPVSPAQADRFFTTESLEKPYVTIKQLDVTYVNFLDSFSIP